MKSLYTIFGKFWADLLSQYCLNHRGLTFEVPRGTKSNLFTIAIVLLCELKLKIPWISDWIHVTVPKVNEIALHNIWKILSGFTCILIRIIVHLL
jgi:hypothetical protein